MQQSTELAAFCLRFVLDVKLMILQKLSHNVHALFWAPSAKVMEMAVKIDTAEVVCLQLGGICIS